MLTNKQLLQNCISTSGWETVLGCIESNYFDSCPELWVLRSISRRELASLYQEWAEEEYHKLFLLAARAGVVEKSYAS